ncbi:hypothetical protein [Bosea sp. 124]|uniref:hypothetical protein n=1 Tax=Bosea sp. 124 TaxID=2135642 RepID=UPI0011B28BD6|nr:hypothetical protein [Bosea sp. 124]
MTRRNLVEVVTMAHLSILGAIVFLAGAHAGSAQAACQNQMEGPLDFSQNNRLTAYSTMDRDGCRYSYALDRNGYNHRLGQSVLEKSEIMSSPKNGSLAQIGQFSFFYKPKPNFIGKDNFVIYVCGTNLGGKGCSRLSYDVTVK